MCIRDRHRSVLYLIYQRCQVYLWLHLGRTPSTERRILANFRFFNLFFYFITNEKYIIAPREISWNGQFSTVGRNCNSQTCCNYSIFYTLYRNDVPIYQRSFSFLIIFIQTLFFHHFWIDIELCTIWTSQSRCLIQNREKNRVPFYDYVYICMRMWIFLSLTPII